MALGIAGELNDRGIKIPDDVLITGFDMIYEARTSCPMIATVSRKWDKIGETVYKELMNQIECHNPGNKIIAASEFIPSESCGCSITTEDEERRLREIKSNRRMTTSFNMQDLMLQKLSVAMSTVETKEDFNKAATNVMGKESFFGPDFCICTNTWLFDNDEDSFPERVRGYSNVVDILYEKRAGVCQPLRSFSSKDLYPGYIKEYDKSNIYIFAPINYMNVIVGYIAVKNTPQVIYNMSFRRLQADLDTMFVSIRQYIFSMQNYRKLKEIYMTDFLTGMYNRTGCEKIIYTFIENRKRSNNKSVFLFVDIDCMKMINDVYGHLNGDMAIKATAEAMRKALPPSFLFGRYGGDEFIAVGPYSDVECSVLKDDISRAIKEYIEELKLSFVLSVSVGYSIVQPKDGKGVADYIEEADKSMYAEKQKAHQNLLST